ncbi:hypothetical protein [Stackebrandtia nassauensis]|uniref:hypothetical protein n=1 Tax=Stackebrandtia nassauensis TaxID=283811 RepID=UPI0001A3A593|nr:hypothetical protein [Stackebrandtia nassauensis]
MNSSRCSAEYCAIRALNDSLSSPKNSRAGSSMWPLLRRVTVRRSVLSRLRAM